MKKIFITLITILSFSFFGNVAAQSQPSTYIDNVDISFGGGNAFNISGQFLLQDFLDAQSVNLLVPDAGNPTAQIFLSNADQNNVSAGVFDINVVSTTNILNFSLDLNGSSSFANGQVIAPNGSFDRLLLSWQNPEGATVSGNPYFLSSASISTTQGSGTVISNDSSEPLPSGTQAGTQDPGATVVVEWATPLLKNTKPDKSGAWYYEISVDEPVQRTSDTTMYLIMTKTPQGGGGSTAVVLNPYGPAAGTVFDVTFPPCDADNLNCSHVTDSPVVPGFNYEAYFSTDIKGAIISHDVAGDGVLTLPDVPASINSSNASSYIDIGATNFLLDDETQLTYLSANINVLSSAPGLYKVFARGIDADGSRPDFVQQIGVIPANVVQPYTLPNVPSNIDVSYDNYEVSVEYDDSIVATKDAGSLANPVTAPSGGGGIISGLTGAQQDLVSGGIVSSECGYNLAKGGRLCGFADAIKLIGRVIEYIFVLILPIAAIVFAYAGFLLLSSGGDTGKRAAAKKAMTNVIIGIVVVMMAWILVRTVLVALGASDGFTMFLF